MSEGKLYIYLALLALFSASAVECKLWWETASFYQIYPRSFKDSNGDGVGDLNGITEQLTYLKEIGIAATWLSPIFTSPMADFGYDIANFTEIDPIFGTLDDFRRLLIKAKAVGVKIILDFVPNHSSDECEWFIKSAARDPEYEDFYVWHSGKPVAGQTRPDPPTNWISVFRGSMWTWHEQRQQYYLHQFHAKQPDLNFRNPEVVRRMKDVLRYWLRMGVSGFRIDAIPHMFEIAADANGNFPDEPRNPSVSNPADHDYLLHIYTVHQPETIDMVYQFRDVLKEVHAELGGDEPILMSEAYAPLDEIMKYYGNDTVDGAQIPFNFVLISNVNVNSTAHDYEQLINSWLQAMPENRTANWVLGNHDQNRIGSRLGKERIDIINTLLLTLPGCSVNYMGEEIGMTDVWISWNDTVDPQACQSTEAEYERYSRDPARTPFQWNIEPMSGFTTGNTTWLPVSDDYQTVNVMRERGISHSHLNKYKELMMLRQETTMKYGNATVLALNDNVLAIKREVPDSADILVIVLNFYDNVEFVDLSSQVTGLTTLLQYEFVSNRSPKRRGDRTFANAVVLMPYDAIVLRNTKL